MALTGAQFGNVCYSSLSQGYDAFFTAVAPVSTSYGDFISYQKILGVWNSVSLFFGALPATYPVLNPCDPLSGFNDGLALGAGLSGILISVLIFSLVMKARG